ncbi:MAG: hypothetical protein E6I91_02640 [Chloroflexi bacterium]|nr:MAG: hypothetical protein E6I91_02640 [Chloroflexota bacterium]
MQNRIPVAVLGATGMVGQRFIKLLQGTPGLRLKSAGARERPNPGRSGAKQRC